MLGGRWTSLPERIEFHRVTADGRPDEHIASAVLTGGHVGYLGVTAQQTFQALASRFGRTDAEIFALVRDNDWSNGWLMAVNPAS
jgi:hypothetical protein